MSGEHWSVRVGRIGARRSRRVYELTRWSAAGTGRTPTWSVGCMGIAGRWLRTGGTRLPNVLRKLCGAATRCPPVHVAAMTKPAPIRTTSLIRYCATSVGAWPGPANSAPGNSTNGDSAPSMCAPNNAGGKIFNRTDAGEELQDAE